MLCLFIHLAARLNSQTLCIQQWECVVNPWNYVLSYPHVVLFVCLSEYMYIVKTMTWENAGLTALVGPTMFYIWYFKLDSCWLCFSNYNYSARNNFWKCPAEAPGQNNIWPASCEFCLDQQVSQICIVPIYVLWDIEVIH